MEIFLFDSKILPATVIYCKHCPISLALLVIDICKNGSSFSDISPVFELVARTSMDFPYSIPGKKYNFSLMLRSSLARNTRKPLFAVGFWQNAEVWPGSGNPQSKNKAPFMYKIVEFG